MTIINLSEFRKPRVAPAAEERFYNRAMTVQHLIDVLGFCDRNAKVYVRNSWMAGVVGTKEYDEGVVGKPTVLLYLNDDELPKS